MASDSGAGKIGLPEAVEAVRMELRRAVEQGADEDLRFPVTSVELEFQVGVTREASSSAALKVWVVEFGAGAGLTRQDVQTVRVSLGPPVDQDGDPVKVHRTHRQP